MESLRQPLLSIRRRWLLILVVTVVAIAIAIVVTATRSTSWTSSSTVIVGSAQGTGRTPTDDAVLARGYVDLLNTPSYQTALRAAAGVPGSLEVTASPVAASPLISISGQAPDAGTARAGTQRLTAAFVADMQRGYTSIFDRRLAPVRARLRAVGTQIAALNAELGGLPFGSETRRSEIAGELTQLTAERTGLAAVLEQQISPAGSPNTVALLRTAGPAGEDGPSLARNGLLGLIGGLALGCAIALFLGAREGELISPHRVRERVGLPVLAELPLGRGTRGAAKREHGIETLAEVLAAGRRPPASILVASAGREAGKELVARGLAEAWAGAGSRVVLVESDSSPSGSTNGNGHLGARILERIAGNGTEAEAEAARPQRNLRVMSAAAPASSRRRTAQPAPLASLLEGGGGRARFLVVSAPPLIGAPLDAELREVSRDGAVLVVDAVHTSADAARAARDTLQRSEATILGVVLVEPPIPASEAARALVTRRR
jgi:polysaccharide biosynthesis transport protein